MTVLDSPGLKPFLRGKHQGAAPPGKFSPMNVVLMAATRLTDKRRLIPLSTNLAPLAKDTVSLSQKL